MDPAAQPPLQQFVAQMGDGLTLGQVAIARVEQGYELRHEADRLCPPAALRLVPLTELRALAQFTATGVFRPLRSAPDLQSGWRALVSTDFELEQALNQLYPGAVADWFAAQRPPIPVTNFREFTQRQTGMYRVTALLEDAQVIRVVRACCHRQFCLKRRQWTVADLPPDTATEKSLIPCLEPCAVLLECARKASPKSESPKSKVQSPKSKVSRQSSSVDRPPESARDIEGPTAAGRNIPDDDWPPTTDE